MGSKLDRSGAFGGLGTKEDKHLRFLSIPDRRVSSPLKSRRQPVALYSATLLFPILALRCCVEVLKNLCISPSARLSKFLCFSLHLSLLL